MEALKQRSPAAKMTDTESEVHLEDSRKDDAPLDDIPTEDLTESYEEDDDGKISKDEAIKAVRALLRKKGGKNIAKKLKKLVAQVDDDTRDIIDGIIAANMPDSVKKDSPEEKVYGCLLRQVDSNTEYPCLPTCVNGYNIRGAQLCKAVVYERKNGKLRKANDVDGSKAYLYMNNDISPEMVEDDCGKIFASNANVDEIFVYHKNDAAASAEDAEYSHIDTAVRHKDKGKDNNSKRNDSTVIAIIAVIVLFVILVALAVWMRYQDEC